MEKLLTFLFFASLISCAEVHTYHCPPVQEHHKVMTHQDEKYLERKQHPFKKPLPKEEKRESYSGREEHLHKAHHHIFHKNNN